GAAQRLADHLHRLGRRREQAGFVVGRAQRSAQLGERVAERDGGVGGRGIGRRPRARRHLHGVGGTGAAQLAFEIGDAAAQQLQLAVVARALLGGWLATAHALQIRLHLIELALERRRLARGLFERALDVVALEALVLQLLGEAALRAGHGVRPSDGTAKDGVGPDLHFAARRRRRHGGRERRRCHARRRCGRRRRRSRSHRRRRRGRRRHHARADGRRPRARGRHAARRHRRHVAGHARRRVRHQAQDQRAAGDGIAGAEGRLLHLVVAHVDAVGAAEIFDPVVAVPEDARVTARHHRVLGLHLTLGRASNEDRLGAEQESFIHAVRVVINELRHRRTQPHYHEKTEPAVGCRVRAGARRARRARGRRRVDRGGRGDGARDRGGAARADRSGGDVRRIARGGARDRIDRGGGARAADRAAGRIRAGDHAGGGGGGRGVGSRVRARDRRAAGDGGERRRYHVVGRGGAAAGGGGGGRAPRELRGPVGGSGTRAGDGGAGGSQRRRRKRARRVEIGRAHV